MGAPWAVLGTATLPQTPPGFIKASTWLTKPGVPCANFPHAPVQHPPCLAGHHPPPLLPYQEEAVLPKHLPKTLKLSGYCYISLPAQHPACSPVRTHPPTLMLTFARSQGQHRGRQGRLGLVEGCSAPVPTGNPEVSGEGCIPAGTKGRCPRS